MNRESGDLSAVNPVVPRGWGDGDESKTDVHYARNIKYHDHRGYSGRGNKNGFMLFREEPRIGYDDEEIG